ncbi:hypothetical protein QJS10_CPA02g00374 [Acorus calamus]|uniref:Uncharacterized protein n=1 Tax=Acorus calamus TaxID=4465 RepID=A0AAV9FCU7_ACOCL|nr:hypothetical protein QJS10_CPA02g00374 [Acorus calamus]
MALGKVRTTTKQLMIIASIAVLLALSRVQLVQSRALHPTMDGGDRSGESSLNSVNPKRFSASLGNHGGSPDFSSLAKLAAGPSRKGKGAANGGCGRDVGRPIAGLSHPTVDVNPVDP